MRFAGILTLLILSLSACVSSNGIRPDLARFQTPLPEFGLTRGPDGWYISRLDGPFGTDTKSQIWRYPFDGSASSPAVFGDPDQSDSDFTWDAKSRRGCFNRNLDIWCSVWDAAAGWSEATKLPDPINTDGYEASPHFGPDGPLYFASQRNGGLGQGDIYRAQQDGSQWRIEQLGDAINSPTGEWNLTISPDGKIMVFESSGRPTNRTVPGDLYWSCLEDGAWQSAQPLHALNTDASDLDFRFIGRREGVFSTAQSNGDAVLRYAGPENFAGCD